jgi:hypothetical protein
VLTLADVSGFKWAENVHAKRLEEALELKRQSEKYVNISENNFYLLTFWFLSFIDMTSHEVKIFFDIRFKR